MLLTYVLARPRHLGFPRQLLGFVVTLALCAAIGAPVALSGRYAVTQADLVEHVFEDNESATAPQVSPSRTRGAAGTGSTCCSSAATATSAATASAPTA